MTLTLLHPLDTTILARLLRESPAIAVDWLQDPDGVGDSWLSATLPERILDLLLLYARDTITCPHVGYERWANGGGPNECPHGLAAGIPCGDCNRLLDAHFTEAVLGAWLECVGDGRGGKVSAATVWHDNSGWRDDLPGTFWTVDVPALSQSPLFREENAARVDLKRRVLGLFSETPRTLARYRIGLYGEPSSGPIDFATSPDDEIRSEYSDGYRRLVVTITLVADSQAALLEKAEKAKRWLTYFHSCSEVYCERLKVKPVDFLPSYYGPSPLTGVFTSTGTTQWSTNAGDIAANIRAMYRRFVGTLPPALGPR